jgi:hypothetical protein
MRKVLFPVVAVTLALLFGPTNALAGQSSSSTCANESCTGKDPNFTVGPNGKGCAADAQVNQTIMGIPGSGDPSLGTQIYTRVMWSNNCQSNWGSVVGSWTPSSIQIVQDITGIRKSGVLYGGSNEAHTPMIYSPNNVTQVTASFRPVGSVVTGWN